MIPPSSPLLGRRKGRMPYETVNGSFERASRVGHSNAAMRALADNSNFYVPAESIGDLEWLKPKIKRVEQFSGAAKGGHLSSAIAIDGSRMSERIRDGLPSVVYGYAQAAAAYVDLGAMEFQRAERFVDPVAIESAVNTALVSLDLPVAGAYTRPSIGIATSWRENLDRIFRTKKSR